ncbi:hypothetical protein BKI52_21365 [marine bacterium AO1-C]|nr:hypothetical protein BKI52_21365 [marine bacterium AO1-C]
MVRFFKIRTSGKHLFYDEASKRGKFVTDNSTQTLSYNQMMYFRKLVTFFFLIGLLLGCQTQSFQQGHSTWQGSLDLGKRGTQKLKAQFYFAKKEGLMLLPDLIPVPLKIKALKKVQDSLFFTVGFRSGPAYCKLSMQKNKITGLMIKEGLPPAAIKLALSDENLIETVVKPSVDVPFVVTTQAKLPEELVIQKRLKALWEKYNLEPFAFTKKVKIQKGTISHSHPVLTLNTKLDTDTKLLSTFLHEQMHWYTLTNHPGFIKVTKALAAKYTKLPVKLPEGAGSEQGTFLHLGVCYLEFHTLAKVIGRKEALAHMQYKTTQYYRWVYRTILKDLSYFEKLFGENGLHFK